MSCIDCLAAIKEILTFFDIDISFLKISKFDNSVHIEGMVIRKNGENVGAYVMLNVDREINKLNEIDVVHYSLENIRLLDGKWRNVDPATLNSNVRVKTKIIQKLQKLEITKQLPIQQKETKRRTHRILQMSPKRRQQVLWHELSELMCLVTKIIEQLRPGISMIYFLNSAHDKIRLEIIPNSSYLVISDYIFKMLESGVFNANSWKAFAKSSFEKN